jgi:hypothetical protein
MESAEPALAGFGFLDQGGGKRPDLNGNADGSALGAGAAIAAAFAVAPGSGVR